MQKMATHPPAAYSVDLKKHETDLEYMGLSENSVPLNPMVNDHYPY